MTVEGRVAVAWLFFAAAHKNFFMILFPNISKQRVGRDGVFKGG